MIQTRSGAHAVRRPAAAAKAAPRRAVDTPVTRIRLVCVLLAALYGALLCQLVRIQWFARARYADGTQISKTRVRRDAALRGSLYDRAGRLLVTNDAGFRVTVDPNAWFQDNAKTPEDSPVARRARTIAELTRRFPNAKGLSRLPSEKEVAPGTPRDSRFPPIDLVRFITPEQAGELRPLALSGVGLYRAHRRRAIDGGFASHVVGSLNADGHGESGVERSREADLHGADGKVRFLGDSRGVVPGTESVIAPLQNGSDLYLTLDASLQHDVEQALAAAVTKHHAESGVAVVLDTKTGDILALANVPTYNVNSRQGKPETRTNQAVTLVSEPGSTLKTITLASALQEGVVQTSSLFQCSGEAQVGNRRIHCASHAPFYHGHGTQSLEGVLKYSCNIATAQCGDRLGPARLEEYLRAFGFGARPRSGLPGESRGIMPDEWSRIKVANVSFGQGIAVSPLQLAAAYTTFVDGIYRSPRIVRGRRDPETGKMVPEPEAPSRRVLSPENAATMRHMLQSVVDGGTGTRAQLDRYYVGGKTGTAQIPEHGRYTNKYVASFVGLAPIGKPEFVILVSIRAPKGEHWGGSVAGPVFKFIAERALLLRDLPTEKEPTPRGRRTALPSAAEAG